MRWKVETPQEREARKAKYWQTAKEWHRAFIFFPRRSDDGSYKMCCEYVLRRYVDWRYGPFNIIIHEWKYRPITILEKDVNPTVR